MSVRMIQAFKAIQASPTQRFVAYMLADAHNEHTERCDPSIATLIDLTGLSKRAIIIALAALEKGGHISTARRGGRRSRYRLHPCIISTGAAHAPVPPPHLTGASGAPPPVQHMHQTGAPRAPEPERTGSLTGMNPEPALARQPGWPRLEEVQTYAETLLTPGDCAEQFWNDCEAVGWVNRYGIPLRDWRPLFRTYATRWKANANTTSARRPASARDAPPNEKPGEIPSSHTRFKHALRDRTLDP